MKRYKGIHLQIKIGAVVFVLITFASLLFYYKTKADISKVEDINEVIDVIDRDFLITYFISIAISFGISFIVTRTLTKPLHKITELTQRIVSEGVTKRIEVDVGGEIGELVEAVNKMGETLRKSKEKALSTAQDLDELFISIIKSLVIAIEAKDPYTSGHSERVTKYSLELAKRLGDFPIESLKMLEYAAILHDIGKIGTSELILHKQGKLTDDEFSLIKNHPLIGAQIIEPIRPLRDAAIIVRHHHERWDGRGYPIGLKGEEIPRESRIVAISDAFDAMTSNRPYRKKMSEEEAIREIMKNKGIQFDPYLADLFVKIYRRQKTNENG
ncbi:MAG: HD-GYP domain-containing protein [bacterium]|nr:HD-GYP domain-containing protein [bacterium]